MERYSDRCRHYYLSLELVLVAAVGSVVDVAAVVVVAVAGDVVVAAAVVAAGVDDAIATAAAPVVVDSRLPLD